MPLLLWIYGGLAALSAFGGAIVMLIVGLDLIAGKGLDLLALVGASVLCAYSAVVAYAILNEKPFVRVLLGVAGGLAVLWSVLDLLNGAASLSLWIDLAIGAFTVWYLFFKPNVIQYFRALKADATKPPRAA